MSSNNIEPRPSALKACLNCRAFTCSGVLESCEEYYVVCIKDTADTIFELAAESKDQEKHAEVEPHKRKEENQIHETKLNSRGAEEGTQDQKIRDKDLNEVLKTPKVLEKGNKKQDQSKEEIKAIEEVDHSQEEERTWQDEVWNRAAKAWKGNEGYMELFRNYCSTENPTKGQE